MTYPFVLQSTESGMTKFVTERYVEQSSTLGLVLFRPLYLTNSAWVYNHQSNISIQLWNECKVKLVSYKQLLIRFINACQRKYIGLINLIYCKTEPSNLLINPIYFSRPPVTNQISVSFSRGPHFVGHFLIKRRWRGDLPVINFHLLDIKIYRTVTCHVLTNENTTFHSEKR